MPDGFGLSVPVEARLDQFAQDMQQLGQMADQQISSIEQKFRDLNPTIGSIAGAAGGLLGAWGLDKALDAVIALNKGFADLAETARSVNLSTDRLQEVQFATALKGLSADDTNSGLQKMVGLLSDARQNENSLSKLLDENDVKYKNRNGTLVTTNQLLNIAADLLQRAPNPQIETEIAKSLGLSQEWVQVLRQGPDAFNAQADAARAAGAVIDQQTIAKAKQFDEEWRKSSVEWGAYMKSALADLLPLLDDLIRKAAGFAETALIAAKGLATVPGGPGSSDIKDIVSSWQKFKDLVSNPNSTFAQQAAAMRDVLFGSSSSNSGAHVELSSNLLQPTTGNYSLGNSPGLAGIDLSAYTNPSKGNPADKDSNDAYDRALNNVKKLTAEYQAQTATIGLNTGAQKEAKTAADLKAAADRAELELTPELKAEIDKYSAALGQAAQATADAKQKYEGMNSAIQSGGNEVISVLDGIRQGSLTGTQAVVQLENALIKAFEQAALLGTGPLASILGTSASAGSGGTGGLLGSLFGVSGRASGGPVSGGVPYLVNENTPNSEIFVPDVSGTIVPQDLIGRGGGSSGVAVNVVNNGQAANVRSQTSNDGTGGMTIDLIMDPIIAKNVGRPGTQTARALLARGIDQPLARR